MAKFTFDARLGDRWLEDLYDADSFAVTSKSSKLVVYTDQFGGSIRVVGSGLVVGSDGTLTAGKVTGLVFRDGSNGTLLTMSEGSFSASKLYAAFDAHGSLYDLMTAATAGNDTFVGSDNAEEITMGMNGGNDTINAAGGDDFVHGASGDDFMNGGNGWDTLSYQDSYYDKAHATKGIVLDAKAGTVKDSWGFTDKIKNFESYRGSHLADKMTGSDASEAFMGLGGKDVIDGGGGWDTVRYQRDERFGGTKGIVADLSKGTVIDGFGKTDTIRNIEGVQGTRFADTFKGNGLDNGFRGFDGVDSYDGGAGYDSVDFLARDEDKAGSVTIDMTRSTLQVRNDGYGNAETLIGIEFVTGGNANDRFTLGTAKMDVGGGAGNDTIIAGRGENYMSGDEGSDTFVFASTKASKAGTTTRDFIWDFSHADDDHIDLFALGHLTFKGTSGHVVGQATVAYALNSKGDTVVGADTNGDGKADLEFVLHGGLKLVASDFILS
jgi:hypothetical protein